MAYSLFQSKNTMEYYKVNVSLAFSKICNEATAMKTPWQFV